MVKKVVIVKVGAGGDQSTVGPFVELLKEVLEEAEAPVLSRGQEKTRAAEVFVASSWKDGVLKADLQDHDMSDTVLVFVTGEMIAEAEKIKRLVPQLKVVVLTGISPQDRVIIAPKFSKLDFARQVVLEW